MSRPLARAPQDWLTKAQDETTRAIAAYKEALKAYRKRKARDRTFEFTFKYAVYGEDSLRFTLNDVYGYKCAYCETFYGASQPVAVEHYRPKGEVIEGKVRKKPGYYWLAATWQNLLPSCTDCNSPRRQHAENGKKVVRGKGNYFPLESGRRAKVPGQEAKEKPLLLNPEVDDPEQHLEFAADLSRAGVIRPALLNGKPSPKGVASIDVYALDRPQLTQLRAMLARRLLSHVRNTKNSERRYRASPNDAGLKEEYEQNLADLREFLSPSQPYCAMAIQIARAELPGVNL